MSHVGQAELRSRAATGQEDRPLTKVSLPFRFKNVPFGRGQMMVMVEFDGPAPPGDRRGTILYKFNDGTPQWSKFITPLKQVCDLFWSMEARQNQLVKERDDAVLECAQAKEELRKAQERNGELDRRLKRKENA